MLKKNVIAHYETAANVARALGITRSGVCQWGRVVPEGTAYKLQALTGGKLKVNQRLYERAAA